MKTNHPLRYVPLIVLAAAAAVPLGLSVARAASQGPAPFRTNRAPADSQDESSRNTPANPDRQQEPESSIAESVKLSGDSAPGSHRQGLVASLTIFVLGIFVGFEVITKVPPTLHTPLMSGSNAISGITIVGAILVSGSAAGGAWLGSIAVMLAAINVVGGFMVTHRMLAMFQKKRRK